MFRGLTTLVVAGTLGVLAAGDVRAQSEPQSTTGSGAQSSASQEPQGQQSQQAAAARQRLIEARESLAEVAKMPEAAELQGQGRTEVSQAISNFNALLTAESDWYDQYKLVMQNLFNVLGPPEAGESAAGSSAGTSGSSTAGSSATGTAGEEVPPALRSKLVEFRQKLMAFGREAGAPDVTGGVSSTVGAGSSEPSSTSGTSGTAGSPPSAQSGTPAAEGESLEQHIDAIDDIIQQALAGTPGSGSSTAGTSGTTESTAGAAGATGTTPGVVTIDREKLDRIQSHLQRMREIARSKGIK
ncbi:MAG TPA: hypothetical protein PKK95_01255 [Vicinamibacterales bacterium]|nr:hypothetical protein [Vicinamibacterales bacterium]